MAKYTRQKNGCESELGKRMLLWRADRPDEWLMDEFIDGVEDMHRELVKAQSTIAEFIAVETDD